MSKIYYEVHSDENENNIYEAFTGRGCKQAAIAYARRNGCESTWVDKLRWNNETETGELVECVWCYAWEE